MAKKPPSPPADLSRATSEIKNRLDHVSGSLHKLATEPGIIFGDPRGTFLDIYLNPVELQEAARIMKNTFFPCITIVVFVGGLRNDG